MSTMCITRAHDYDTNGELDGLELVQAIMHEMDPFVVKEETIKELDLRPIDIQYRVDVVTNDRVDGIMSKFTINEVSFFTRRADRLLKTYLRFSWSPLLQW